MCPDVVLDRLIGQIFHQGHMFVSCRMIYDIWPVFFENSLKPVVIPYGTDQYGNIGIRKMSFQFHLDLICVVFINIKDYQLGRIV